MTAHRSAVWMCLAALLSTACGGPEQSALATAPTFEEFLTRVYQEPDTGLFIANGDEVFDGEKNLREFYELKIRGDESLIVNTSGGVDTKWTDTQKLNLTYCVSNNFGSTNKARVVEALRQATDSMWEAAANVNFVYVPAQDASCTASNTNVVFDVRPVNVGGQYLARAFFPNNSRSSRNVLIDNTAFGNVGWSLANILAHELGHALGFRHEHTRPEAGACFEDNSWRPLTPYDSASIMHYPQCNGTSDDLSMTTRDRQGAATLYGSPGSQPPPPPPPTTVTVNLGSGSLSRTQTRTFPGFAARVGTLVTVSMTGSGDPDLYVRFNAAPTTTAYNCRPYTSGANETCSLTVPAGTSAVYVMVRGYTASTYNVSATYTPP